jgi:hypothetical protein
VAVAARATASETRNATRVTCSRIKGLTPRTRGPKPTRSPQDEEIRQLREANQRLTEDLRKAAIVIDVQKKVAALLEDRKPSSGFKEPR